uniref:GntT/GntP/DsdX family permease n=1 Tax=Bacillus cereus TaxID=1396 RepID=UPI002D78ABB2|nr:hypothetical protein [Bacillus cereus]
MKAALEQLLHKWQNIISLSPIVLAFMVAGLIRIATGSATVALTTAAGLFHQLFSTCLV